jgi:hypothetical protein
MRTESIDALTPPTGNPKSFLSTSTRALSPLRVCLPLHSARQRQGRAVSGEDSLKLL